MFFFVIEKQLKGPAQGRTLSATSCIPWFRELCHRRQNCWTDTVKMKTQKCRKVQSNGLKRVQKQGSTDILADCLNSDLDLGTGDQ